MIIIIIIYNYVPEPAPAPAFPQLPAGAVAPPAASTSGPGSGNLTSTDSIVRHPFPTPEDHLPPRPPGLQPVINLVSFNGKKRGPSYNLSEDDDLNFVGLLYPNISIGN